MTQNTSTAVMSRRLPSADDLDYYPTPPWATRALCEYVVDLEGYVWEPACGEGHMAKALCDYAGGHNIFASDVHDYGWGDQHGVHDFLQPYGPDFVDQPISWVVTNPPFVLAREFVLRGLEVADRGVAMLCRSVFMEGGDRYRTLFKPAPPAIVAPFVERVPMIKGRLDEKASSATSYAWFVWGNEPAETTRVVWIPPCRKRLERPGDYA